MSEEENVGVKEPTAEAQEAPQEQAQQPQSDKEINFKAQREVIENLKRQNDLLQMQLMQQQQPAQQQQQDFDLENFKDDDIPNYGELKRIFQKDRQERHKYLEKIKDLEMRSSHQDYEKVIRDYLPDVLQDDPDLALAIKDNPQMHKLAYKLAQASPRYHQEKLLQKNEASVQKIVENTTRPQPANARKNVVAQDEESRYKNMSDDDIMRVFNMAKARS